MPVLEISALPPKAKRTNFFKRTPSKIQISYTISTPAKNDALQLDPALATILFLHPTYVPKELFHPQFNDRGLRSTFNCIAFDFRGHGKTKGSVEYGFASFEDAAEDVLKVMDALNCSSAHIVGVCSGANTGLWLAINHRERVLSLTLMSPLPQVEPPEVAQGRIEMLEAWEAGVVGGDADGMALAAQGAVQIGFEGDRSITSHRIIMNAAFPGCIEQWHGKKGVEIARLVCVQHVVHRKPIALTDFAKLAGLPVLILHGANDILYPSPTEMRGALGKAGVVAELEIILGAPAFMNVAGFLKVNHLLRTFIGTNSPPPASPSIPPPANFVVASPFESLLFPEEITSGGEEEEDE